MPIAAAAVCRTPGCCRVQTAFIWRRHADVHVHVCNHPIQKMVFLILVSTHKRCRWFTQLVWIGRYW